MIPLSLLLALSCFEFDHAIAIVVTITVQKTSSFRGGPSCFLQSIPGGAIVRIVITTFHFIFKVSRKKLKPSARSIAHTRYFLHNIHALERILQRCPRLRGRQTSIRRRYAGTIVVVVCSSSLTRQVSKVRVPSQFFRKEFVLQHPCQGFVVHHLSVGTDSSTAGCRVGSTTTRHRRRRGRITVPGKTQKVPRQRRGGPASVPGRRSVVSTDSFTGCRSTGGVRCQSASKFFVHCHLGFGTTGLEPIDQDLRVLVAVLQDPVAGVFHVTLFVSKDGV
mmetsp:Transcript_8369/g.17415  ORF Transcript_8369/g.17415 Transcript_8369/m.17415 type:complete len:277 (-) Transcript_8369:358-1188(-)